MIFQKVANPATQGKFEFWLRANALEIEVREKRMSFS